MLTLWRRPDRRNSQSLPLLKKLFWLYFLLLVFDGALRKWVAPQLSAPLLLVRDPVAFWIIWEAYRTRKWPQRWSALIGVLTLAILALCAVQMIVSTDPWFVEIYGLRTYLLPFPVAFIMGENLDAEDLRRFGVCMLWLLLPFTVLEMAQYLAPPSAWVNAGAYASASQIIYAGDTSGPRRIDALRHHRDSNRGWIADLFMRHCSHSLASTRKRNQKVCSTPPGDVVEALYNRAVAVLFPSRLEGFGWLTSRRSV